MFLNDDCNTKINKWMLCAKIMHKKVTFDATSTQLKHACACATAHIDKINTHVETNMPIAC